MKNNLYRFLNNPAFDALQKLHEQFDNSALFSTMNELQRTLDMVKVPTSGITAALQTYQDSIAPLMSTVQNINNLYAPILEQTKKYEGVYNSSMVAVLQSSAAAIRELVELENGVNFNDNAEIAIVLTQEELDDFVSSLGKDSRCCKLYMGHDLLPSGDQENILAAQGIMINIIPDYYYRDLQEG